MIRMTAIAAAALALAAGSAHGALLAGWDFQTTASGGTAAAAAPNSPNLFAANFGSGTLYLNGAHGAASWNATSSGNELTAGTGTAANTAGTPFSTDTAGPASLSLVNASASGSRAIVFGLSMSGYQNLAVSYAAAKSASNAFATHAWAYSTDGSTWTALQNASNSSTNFTTITLSPIAALDNAPAAYLRMTLTGSGATGTNNRLDNFQFNAAPLPAPQTLALTASAPGSYAPVFADAAPGASGLSITGAGVAPALALLAFSATGASPLDGSSLTGEDAIATFPTYADLAAAAPWVAPDAASLQGLSSFALVTATPTAGTASLGYSLPAGYTLARVAAIPEPAAATLLLPALALTARRRA